MTKNVIVPPVDGIYKFGPDDLNRRMTPEKQRQAEFTRVWRRMSNLRHQLYIGKVCMIEVRGYSYVDEITADLKEQGWDATYLPNGFIKVKKHD